MPLFGSRTGYLAARLLSGTAPSINWILNEIRSPETELLFVDRINGRAVPDPTALWLLLDRGAVPDGRIIGGHDGCGWFNHDGRTVRRRFTQDIAIAPLRGAAALLRGRRCIARGARP